MPNCTARRVITVASQLAKAARNSQPGDGPDTQILPLREYLFSPMHMHWSRGKACGHRLPTDRHEVGGTLNSHHSFGEYSITSARYGLYGNLCVEVPPIIYTFSSTTLVDIPSKPNGMSSNLFQVSFAMSYSNKLG